MNETQRRAYGIGKDARKDGVSRAELDSLLDWAVNEGVVPDTYEVDLYARMGFTGELAA